MTRYQFSEITAWQKITFPNADELSKLHHLKKELDELIEAIEQGKPYSEVRLEYADCFFLLFGSCAAGSMTYDDIVAAIEEKFFINKKRKWGKPDENGVVEHVD